MKKQSFLLYLFICVATVFLVTNCANPVTPTGGPKDVTPPQVIESEPLNYSINFKAEKIKLEFDEFIEFDEANKQLLVSPPLDNKPEFKIRGKSLIIEPQDELKQNITYTLFFGDAIKDITEKNPLLDFHYVFATGATLDSLTIKGKVLDAFNLQPEMEEIFVMLYLDINDTIPFDSIPYLSRPYYIAKTDENGNFQLKNLKNDSYKIFVLKDANSNYLYDLPNEKIAFLDSLLMPEFFKSFVISDSLINDTILSDIQKDSLIREEFKVDSINKSKIHYFYYLYLFDEIDSTQHLTSVKLVREGEINFVFKFPTKDLKIETLNYTFGKDCQVIEDLNPGKDTMTYWLSKNYPDTLLFKISQDSLILDTTEIVLFKEEKKKPKDEEDIPEKISSLKHKTNIQNNYLNLNTELKLEFTYPLEKYELEKVLLIKKEKDTIVPEIEFTDSIKRKFIIKEKLEEAESYELFFPDSVFTDILGYSNDSASIYFQIKELQNYGTLQINITNTKNGSNYILQLLDDRENILKEINVSEDGIIIIEYLDPNAYKLKLILDTNNNGRWDTGDYIKNIPPEKVYYFKNTLNVRANWDIEENWEL
ncbi:MAG: Ig-like domain-containing protein [Bacteroidales bacterium]|nr:Ig-like domain-containing protein [Bacteroidales bacterium]